MQQRSFATPIALDAMRMLGLAAITFFAFSLLPARARAQVEAPPAQMQKIPSNVKTRAMTADELKKVHTESVLQARGTPRTPVRHPASGLMRVRPEVLTVLEQQKAFVASRGVGMARPQALSRPLLQNQGNLGPGTTMNSKNPSPGNSAQPTTGGRTNTGAKTNQDTRLLAPQPLRNITAVCQSPAISDVNGQATKAVFTPQPEYNNYVIRGCFFGTSTGQVYLVGKFNALKINLQPTYWIDNEIDARVDPNVAGELDQDNVSLVVAPVNGQQMKTNGFKFYAVRSDPAVLLPSIPQAWALLSIAGGNVLTTVQEQNVVTAYLSPVGPDAPKNTQGWTVFVERWNGHGKFAPLADFFFFNKLTPGWNTDSFQTITFDPAACLGVVTYRQTFGTWDPEWQGDDIRMNWADTSCSGFVPQPPVFPLFVSTYSDVTGSAYALNVWVRGPRCTDPYTGKLQQQCVQNVRTCGSETCGH